MNTLKEGTKEYNRLQGQRVSDRMYKWRAFLIYYIALSTTVECQGSVYKIVSSTGHIWVKEGSSKIRVTNFSTDKKTPGAPNGTTKNALTLTPTPPT